MTLCNVRINALCLVMSSALTIHTRRVYVANSQASAPQVRENNSKLAQKNCLWGWNTFCVQVIQDVVQASISRQAVVSSPSVKAKMTQSSLSNKERPVAMK